MAYHANEPGRVESALASHLEDLVKRPRFVYQTTCSSKTVLSGLGPGEMSYIVYSVNC